MAFHIFFDGPDNYNPLQTFFHEGANPNLLTSLIGYINNKRNRIEKVYAALYLYNNRPLHDYLRSLADAGIEVNIVSIPLDGYDDRVARTPIRNLRGEDVYHTPQSKYTLAKEIYDEIKGARKENFNFYIFPHMFVRSENVRPFARGTLPYSLHIKAFYFEKENNSSALAMISSNLAARDQTKDENLIIIDGEGNGRMASNQFFKDLISQSISIYDFDESSDYHNYEIEVLPSIGNDYNWFTAPFYANSNDDLEEFLIGKIMAAERRIYVMGQHLAAFNYRFSRAQKYGEGSGFERRRGLLGAVIEKAAHGLDVRCLSQTYIDENGREVPGATAPVNRGSFKEFIRAYNQAQNTRYAVNKKAHSKYIVIDNAVVVTTFNWTPTQFIYLPHVDIPDFSHMPGVAYRGIHSEVGQLLYIEKSAVVQEYVRYFEGLWDNHRTTVIR